jgi:hypothetical protein
MFDHSLLIIVFIEINARIKQIGSFPGREKLNKGIFRIVESKKAGNKITTQPLTDTEYESFMDISVLAYVGYVYLLE